MDVSVPVTQTSDLEGAERPGERESKRASEWEMTQHPEIVI